MRSIRKSLALLLIVLVTTLSLMLLAESANAQKVPKPSAPEFSLRYIENSYYVPPVTAVDPYTGNTVTTQEGYQASNNTIEIKIRNQPYSGWINGSEVWIVFNVQQKGHYGNDTGRTLYSFNQYNAGTLPNQSTSDFTIISVPANDLPAGGSVDFQVQAIAEYKTTVICYPHIGTDLGAYAATGYAIADYSDWSDAQTIRLIDETVNNSSPTPALIATETSNNSGINGNSADFITLPIGSFVVVVAVVVILAAAVVLLLLRRHPAPPRV